MLGPTEFIFYRGGWLYRHGKVKIIDELRLADRDQIFFKVNGHIVRLEVEKVKENIFTKKFTCSCDIGANAKYNNICAHIVACITHYSIMLSKQYSKRG